MSTSRTVRLMRVTKQHFQRTFFLVWLTVALLAASCGGSEELVEQSDGTSVQESASSSNDARDGTGDSQVAGAEIASDIDGASQGDIDAVIDQVTGGSGEAGEIEVTGDSACPVMATDTLETIVGGELFNRATFQEFREWNSYFCEWLGPGTSVQLVVFQLTDIRDLDSPTYFDELSEASSEDLIEHLGAFGDWPEVWEVDPWSRPYAFGQHVYQGRGTPIADTATCFPDERSRMSPRVVLALDFSAADEAGHTELAGAFFSSADDSYIPMHDNYECE